MRLYLSSFRVGAQPQRLLALSDGDVLVVEGEDTQLLSS
jgi:hypothetical protein